MNPDEWRESILKQLTDATDQYVISMAMLLGLTIEQLAEQYALEYEPASVQMSEDMVHRDDVRMRVTQKVRLVRREDGQ